MSNALLLADEHEVIALDLDQSKVDRINQGLSPIVDLEVEEKLKQGGLPLRATTDPAEAYAKSKDVPVI